MATQLDAFDQKKNAEIRMEQHFKLGTQQQEQLLATVSKTVIMDRLVPPRSMYFHPLTHDKQTRIHLSYEPTGPAFSIHRHALTQLCQKVQLPMAFVNTLQGVDDFWRFELLAHNLNQLFQKPTWEEKNGAPIRFLHRIVDKDLRGFLSRRFNRHLASAPLLRAFIDACTTAGAKPVEAASSPVRSALKCILPAVFEIFPGEYVCVGTEWSNSDFGVGKLKVLQTMWRIKTGSAVVLDEGLARAHIGSVIEDSDIEMSDETARKEVAAQQSAVTDHVREYLSEGMVDKLVTGVRAARDQKIPWAQLRARLRDVLGKNDLDWMQNTLDMKGESIIDLPPISFEPDGSAIPNLYWASSFVSAIATKATDADRKLELQREAGKLLGKSVRDAA